MSESELNKEKRDAAIALKTAKGQIEGIIKMLEEGRYCVDISDQIMAAQSMLKRANRLILVQHVHGCVKGAANDPVELENKMEELSKIFGKLL